MSSRPIIIASRGSALALAQSAMIQAQCRAAFPDLTFEIKVIKTTGDKMQTLSLANPNQQVTKGLFTKELEVALLNGEADFAVHSLKDLPTELPDGLVLGAVSQREDVRDVLIYRDADFLARQTTAAAAPPESGSAAPKRGFKPKAPLADFPSGATIATSSTRRLAQLLALRPDFKVVPIRGNVGTRLQKLSERPELDGIILATAGLHRLNMRFTREGVLTGETVPDGLNGFHLGIEEMLPCVGQAALGIELRAQDERIQPICDHLNDWASQQCVLAERAFLHAMGGGCLSPVAAYADFRGEQIRLRAISFRNETIRRAEGLRAPAEAALLGRELAAALKS